MRFHRPFIALCVAIAIVSIGSATFIAAASPAQRPAAVFIATAASDDVFVPPEAPPTVPTEPTLAATTCRSATAHLYPVNTTLNVNNAVPLQKATVGAIRIGAIPTGGGLCPSGTSLIVSGVTLKFDWENLAGGTVARLRDIAVGPLNGQPYGRYVGTVSSDARTRETTITFNQSNLSIPFGEERTIYVTADTRDIRASRGALTKLRVTATRVATDVAFGETIGDLSYLFFPAHYTTMEASRSPHSPADRQARGARKNLAIFRLTPTGPEPLRLRNLHLVFNDGRLQSPFRPSAVRVRIEREGGGMIGHELGPSNPTARNEIIFDNIAPTDIILHPLVTYTARIIGDTSRARSGQTLNALLWRLQMVGQNSGMVFDRLLERPISGNTIKF